ncbi:hypothetical protein [Profundibacter sp.]
MSLMKALAKVATGKDESANKQNSFGDKFNQLLSGGGELGIDTRNVNHIHEQLGVPTIYS